MKIREVTEEDMKNWLELRYELWPYYELEELADNMREVFAKRSSAPVFVVEDDQGQLCGFIELSVHDQAPGCSTTKIGFIEGWYVKEEYQQQGIGRRLVELGEDWARSIGCREMASDTTERYPVSPKAHQALGYEEVIPLHFRKDL